MTTSSYGCYAYRQVDCAVKTPYILPPFGAQNSRNKNYPRRLCIATLWGVTRTPLGVLEKRHAHVRPRRADYSTAEGVAQPFLQRESPRWDERAHCSSRDALARMSTDETQVTEANEGALPFVVPWSFHAGMLEGFFCVKLFCEWHLHFYGEQCTRLCGTLLRIASSEQIRALW